MSQPGHIDGLQFAREGGRRDGHLAIESLPRLAACGACTADVAYVLAGATTARGKPCLHIEADGTLELVCQRCLGAIAHRVRVRSELELASRQDAIDGAQDDEDRVLATTAMDVRALVEDELILDLPMIPMHAQCGAAAVGQAREPSPFAALAVLKRHARAETD